MMGKICPLNAQREGDFEFVLRWKGCQKTVYISIKPFLEIGKLKLT